MLHDWVLKNLPGTKLCTVEPLLGVSELDLKTAHGTSLLYEGWVEVDCKLIGTDHNYGVKIPFLVSKDMLDLIIIGYNVIEKITQNSVDNFEQPPTVF